jgi:hypothetical protein
MVCNCEITHIAVDGHTAIVKAGKFTLHFGIEFKHMNEWQHFKERWV